MRVENYRLDLTVRSEANVQQAQGVEGQAGSPPQQSATDSAHTAAPDLVHWLTEMRQMHEVRQDVLQAVRQRLESGDYLTPAAAERVAEAILGDGI